MSRAWKNTIRLEQIREDQHDKAAVGLFKGAEHILQVSNERVPIEEGTLERTGATSIDEVNLRAAISYDTLYAVKQHEDLTLHHDDGRTAKYLESAMNGSRDEVRKIIAAELAFGQG